MQQKITLMLLCTLVSVATMAQSTGERVYQIFQTNCVSCHSASDPAAGLDLEGVGATAEAQALDVYTKIFEVTPNNSFAAAKGYEYITPGRPDLSMIFRKVNHGLEPTIELDPQEGAPMPNGMPAISEVEREMIRQWILFGAPIEGEVVPETRIEEFYNGMGAVSFTEPPAPPPVGEGFQIKMGPFYLDPAGATDAEVEFFQKYALDLPDDVEVDRIDIKFSNYSRHFILYDFDNPAAANVIPEGLRLESFHNEISLTAAVQEPTDLRLPENTAWYWDNDLVLDLNSHYINYSATEVYQAETYLNVYTKPTGTAMHEMETRLIVNGDIYIPNDGSQHEFSQTYNPNLGEIYLWNIMGHTHQWGTGYTAAKRELFNETDLIYDGSCPGGVPGCASPFFDYQHIPPRYFDELLPLTMNNANGMIHHASWENYGDSPVWFGPTSDDEMMVMIIMFTRDSTGLNILSTDKAQGLGTLEGVQLMPNPVQDVAFFSLPEAGSTYSFRLYDLMGREIFTELGIRGMEYVWQRQGLTDGMYVYRIEDETGRIATGKVRLE
ncbi:MAG: T9SS type A sorting domain-containing protein [Bacteroidota bacterium]